MKVIRTIVLACLGGLLPTAAVGQTIVWTDISTGRIQSKDVNGGEVQTIVQFQFPQRATQIHYDPIAARLYYLFFNGETRVFQRANLDGSDPEDIPTPSVGVFTLNVEWRKLYWIREDSRDVLYRSELDGTGVESHTYSTCCLLTLEAVSDDLFFGTNGSFGGKGIWRADADGSNEQLLQRSGQPFDMAHDPVENKLYVGTIEGIYRLNLDGTDFEEIVPSAPPHIVVDSRARKVYWGGFRIIRRSNLDGSNVEDFVTAADAGNPNLQIRGLTIVDSEAVAGACCNVDPIAPCRDDTILSQCECVSCLWRPFRTCAEIECAVNPIPTASAWGLVVLALLLMIAAKIAFARPAASFRLV